MSSLVRPRRVLIVRMSSLGDIVLTEPVVASLSEALPGVEIGFAVKASYADLVSGNPSLSRLHLLQEGGVGALASLCREVRRARYDAVVDLHRNLRSAVVSAWSGAPVRTGYRKRELVDTLRVRFGRGAFRARRRLVERYLEALEPLGVRAQYRRPVFHMPSGAMEAARERLAAAGLRERAYVVVAPGAIWATKRWPAERFAEVMARLKRERGLDALLIGAPAERALCEEVAVGVEGARVLAGETPLSEMAGIISLASLYVGNDSGPTHVAMALSVPTVAIFGPTDPGQFDHEGHELVYADPDCGACSFFGGRECRLGHWKCMTSLSAADVFAAAVRLLGGDGGRDR